MSDESHSDPQCSTRAPVEGNTNLQPVKEKRKTRDITPSKKWCFTLNNYDDDDVIKMIDYFKSLDIEYIIGKEHSASGTPHLQGYVELKKKSRPSMFKGLPFKWNKAHWEVARGTTWDNIKYCSKEGFFFTSFDTKDYAPYTIEIELYPWQQRLFDMIQTHPDNRTINWIWEPVGGRGKTVFQKYCYLKTKRCIVLSGKAEDMKNGIIQYEQKNGYVPRCVFVNIPRVNQNHLSIAGLESIKDMFFFCGKYEGGMVCGPSPHVFVFANEPPNELDMSQDRWNIINLDELDNLSKL